MQQPTRVLFGYNAVAKIGEKVKEWRVKKALIVTDEGVKKAGILERLGYPLKAIGVDSEVFSDVKPNSGDKIVRKGRELARQSSCDVVVGVGGGSSIDTAKAIAAMITNKGSIKDYEGLNKIKNRPLPVVAIPTTAGTGSEVTLWAVITDQKQRRKVTIGSPLITPTLAIDDPLLTVSMPSNVTATTGMDALTHAMESYVNTATQPISECLALNAIELIGKNLRLAVANGENIQARYNMLVASLMAGLAFSHTRLGNSHALALPLGGGGWQVPHGAVNAILLPHVMEFNLISNLEKFASIAEAMGQKTDGLSARRAGEKAIEAVKELSEDIGIPRGLGEFGVKEKDLLEVAQEAIKSGNVMVNPRKTTVEDLVHICKKAL